MLALCRLPLLLVEGPDALLESQERLVDLRSLSLPILVIALTVLSPFRSCEVYKEELTASFHSLLLDLDLGNGMTSTGGVISLGCMSRSHLITLVDQLQYLIIIVDELFLKTSNLDGVALVLSQR